MTDATGLCKLLLEEEERATAMATTAQLEKAIAPFDVSDETPVRVKKRG